MKNKKMTLKRLFSVPCPTCGASVGNRCVLHTGSPRSRVHVDRKFVAVEANESGSMTKFIIAGKSCGASSGTCFLRLPLLRIRNTIKYCAQKYSYGNVLVPSVQYGTDTRNPARVISVVS